MSKLGVLLEIIKGVSESVSIPEALAAEKGEIELELSPLNSSEVLALKDSKLVVNTNTEEGKQISDEVFKKADELTEKGERVIESDFGGMITGATKYANIEEENSDFFTKIKDFVPASDIPIIRSAILVRTLFQKKEPVDRYKELIYQKYSSRGNNITNLLSAGYYEDYLLPTYEHLVETEGSRAKNIFREIYEEAVTQYPFAVFVSKTKDYTQIKSEITRKIQLNVLNEQHVLNIHGIGKKNIRTINKVLSDPDITRLYISEPDFVQLRNTIYARIYF